MSLNFTPTITITFFLPALLTLVVEISFWKSSVVLSVAIRSFGKSLLDVSEFCTNLLHSSWSADCELMLSTHVSCTYITSILNKSLLATRYLAASNTSHILKLVMRLVGETPFEFYWNGL